MSNHSLVFANGYQQVQVLDASSNVVASYNLTNSNQSLGIHVASGNYELAYAEGFSDPVHAVDVGGGSTLFFDGARIGGGGICDLRDMKTSSQMQVEELSFELACDTFYLKYEAGPYALRLKYADDGCCSFTIV